MLGWNNVKVFSQDAIIQDTLVLTESELHQRFVAGNLVLLAERLNIDIAEAAVRQARLWENPSFEIDEVNLWATEHQLTLGESLPPIFGDEFGRNRQIAMQVEQLIYIAGKRNKRIAVEQVNKRISKEYFDLLALSLKKELQENIAEMLYLEQKHNLIKAQQVEIQKLVNSAKSWYESRDIPRIEYYRLISLLKSVDIEIAEITNEIIDLQAQLRVLLIVPFNNYIKIIPENIDDKVINIFKNNFETHLSKSLQNNPQIKIADLNIKYHENLLRYEKSYKYPDIALSVGYDRGGNFLLDFIGFGISMDIPVFNRNQGNIRMAEIELEQNKILQNNTKNQLENELFAAWQKLLQANEMYNKFDKSVIEDFDKLMEKMNEYYAARSVGMLEFLDFYEAYTDMISKYIKTEKELRIAMQNLLYLTGE